MYEKSKNTAVMQLLTEREGDMANINNIIFWSYLAFLT